MAQGALLTGWILIHTWMVRDMNPLQVSMLITGLLLLFSGALIQYGPAGNQR